MAATMPMMMAIVMPRMVTIFVIIAAAAVVATLCHAATLIAAFAFFRIAFLRFAATGIFAATIFIIAACLHIAVFRIVRALAHGECNAKSAQKHCQSQN